MADEITEPTPEDWGWERPEEEQEPSEASLVAPEETPLPVFDEKFRQDFEGLLFLGKLSHRFVWMGHEFVIRTLSTDEILEVGLLQKPFVGSMGETKAYQTAVVAACLVSVDGRNLPIPISNDPSDTMLSYRFRYVSRYFPPTIDVVFEQYIALEKRVYEIMEAMGKV